MKITMQLIMSLSYCKKGIVKYCEKNSIDYEKLINDGLDKEDLYHLKDDIMIQKIFERMDEWEAAVQNHN